ncbi:hypothetical protein Z043_102507, partial [Scleropages formosus]
VIKEKGLEHVTVEDLVAEITPKGRGIHRSNLKILVPVLVVHHSYMVTLVPDSVKKELLQRIRAFLAQHSTL